MQSLIVAMQDARSRQQTRFRQTSSTRIPQLPEARWNPGAAKASDCEVSKSFCAFARRCYEARHPLEAPLIDVCSEAETHRLRCGRVAPRAFCRSQLRNPDSIVVIRAYRAAEGFLFRLVSFIPEQFKFSAPRAFSFLTTDLRNLLLCSGAGSS